MSPDCRMNSSRTIYFLLVELLGRSLCEQVQSNEQRDLSVPNAPTAANLDTYRRVSICGPELSAQYEAYSSVI